MPANLTDLEAQTKKNEAELADLRRWKQQQERLPVNRKGVPAGAPFVTTGGFTGSQPYRLYKALGLVNGKLRQDQAKTEYDVSQKIRKAMQDTGAGLNEFGADTLIVPFNSELMPDVLWENKDYCQAMAEVHGGVLPADPEEMAAIRKSMAIRRKSEVPMSAYADAVGGTLVAPPVMGPTEELMRPVPGLQRAGARVVPLPPNGRYVAPRIVSPTTGYWIKENAAVTESALGTGQWGLTAKKLGVLARVPNELYKFSAGATDASLRQDMSVTMELGLDYAGLYGTGAEEPTGLSMYTGTNEVQSYTAGTVGADGNTLLPQDGYKMVGLVEDRNFEFQGWLLRSILWSKLISSRADAVTPGDAAGPFVQDLTRSIGFGPGDQWDGYRVTKSNVIKNNIAKGSATNLTEIWGGMWNKLTIGMYGAMEFAMSNQAGTAFVQDQTLVRGILFCDVGTPYPGAFIKCTSLICYS